MPVRHNTKEFIDGMEKKKRAVHALTERIATKAGDIMREEIKNELPPHNQGVSQWKGWEAKGTLKSQVVHTAATAIPNGHSVTVYMNLNANTRKYFVAHEDGMTIKAKTSRGMIFYSIPHGRFIRRMTVTIRPKHYWSTGVETGKRKIREMVPKEISVTFKEG